MKFRPAQTFWEAYAILPSEVKEQVREAFRRFPEGAENPPFHYLHPVRLQRLLDHPLQFGQQRIHVCPE